LIVAPAAARESHAGTLKLRDDGSPAAGDSAFEELRPDLCERMLSNGETLLFIEMPIFSRYRPEDTVVGAIRQPMWVLQGLVLLC